MKDIMNVFLAGYFTTIGAIAALTVLEIVCDLDFSCLFCKGN